MKYHVIPILGKAIAYVDTNKDKTPILFIHGNSLSYSSFKNQFTDTELTKAFRLIALDMLGYGESDRAKDPEKEYGFYAQADLVHAFITKLNLKRVILVGHSLGGNIAIEVANKCKDVRAIVLLACPLAEKPMSQEMYLPHPALPYFFTPDLEDDNIRQLLSALFKPETEIPEWIAAIVKKSDPLTRAHLLAPVMTGEYTDQLLTLRLLNLPTAVFIGEYDQLANSKYIKKTRVLTQWKNEVNEITDGGHMFFYENARPFNKLLIQFGQAIIA